MPLSQDQNSPPPGSSPAVTQVDQPSSSSSSPSEVGQVNPTLSGSIAGTSPIPSQSTSRGSTAPGSLSQGSSTPPFTAASVSDLNMLQARIDELEHDLHAAKGALASLGMVLHSGKGHGGWFRKWLHETFGHDPEPPMEEPAPSPPGKKP